MSEGSFLKVAPSETQKMNLLASEKNMVFEQHLLLQNEASKLFKDSQVYCYYVSVTVQSIKWLEFNSQHGQNSFCHHVQLIGAHTSHGYWTFFPW